MRLGAGSFRAAGVIVASWGLFGVLLGQQVYLLQAGRGPAGVWSHAMALELDYCLLWALATPGVLWLGRRFPLATPRALQKPASWWKAVVHLPASLACSMLVQVAHSWLLSRLYPGWFPRPAPGDIARSLVSNVDYGFILYWIVLLIGQSFDYVRSLEQAQVRHAELQEQVAEAQLQALQMQMHPHFLFNTFNSIAELIHEDPGGAERMLTSLGELLRVYLRSGETQESSLAQELDFLRRYLEIQQIRFEDRLSVQIAMSPGAETAVVPSLLLQPLVENAILHGISDREQDGVVQIDASVHETSLVLRVADNGHGLVDRVEAPLVEGRGLGNTRRRLERLYGKHHDFSIRTVEGGGTCASIRIPLKQP